MNNAARRAIGVPIAALIGSTALLRAGDPPAATQPAATHPAAASQPAGRPVALTLSGGHETDRRDGGRPVVLIAAALGVPVDAFREAFSHVRPSRNGPPSDEEARRNKAALLSRLSKFGVTNDRLDAVSDHYRYRREEGEVWTHRPATAVAFVADGKLVDIQITDAGAGYSSPPTVTLPDRPDVILEATLAFDKDLATNGSLAAVTVKPPAAPASRPTP